jgi:hypothetical protein
VKYPSIRLEGPILSPDIVDRIAEGDYPGQEPSAFGLDGRVKDEITRAWADTRALWGMFVRRREHPAADDRLGTRSTRFSWMLPLLGLLGYELEYQREAPEIRGKKYPVSHRAANRGDLPVHVIGHAESLDERESRAMSAHSLVQEYLNLADDHLYALVANGLRIRLLRDASRLVRLSFVEFDLERMMTDGLFADFAIFFRILHSSRMPDSREAAAECILERYHQDAMENGERIRGGLSSAVESSIAILAEGFLNDPANEALARSVEGNQAAAEGLGHEILLLIYRLLFLLVIEERDLVFGSGSDERKRSIYERYYSAGRLRRLSEIARPEDGRKEDLWVQLRQTFQFFEEGGAGDPLGIAALGGNLFKASSIKNLASSSLANEPLASCMRSLSRFYDNESRQEIRVNYGALNVEEFGSVYEGLLEKDPVVARINGRLHFSFRAGEARSSSGSHYTPEELTHPLIRNSLDHVIASLADETDRGKALLSIRVCDPACGSGHILLNAARRIGLELARARTSVDQPPPPDIRRAVRDAIRHCVYGVDKNPYAVELCKVALWLESHDPGQPLGFLDHHIKCGDSVVGIAHREELLEGIPEEAFKRQAGDDGTAASFGKRNRKEREARGQMALQMDTMTMDRLEALQRGLETVDGMDEHTAGEIERKRIAYENLVSQEDWRRLRELSDILTAQFFLPKTEENVPVLVTDGEFLSYMGGGTGGLFAERVTAATAVAREQRFFHWFIEFPEVFEHGGFDCILGNPPFLGGLKISTNYGSTYLHYLQSRFAPARGTCDLVGYFFRRVFSLINDNGHFGLIATNTIAQGGTREGSLEPISAQGGEITFAVRSMKWPGLAAVSVSLVAVFKGTWKGERVLDGRRVKRITPYLDDAEFVGNPFKLAENAGKSFQGSIVLGMGFVLEPEDARALIKKNPRNNDVLYPYLNGEDLNGRPDQSPSRWVIQFDERTEEEARAYPDCFEILERKVKPERIIKDAKKYPRMVNEWWKFWNNRQELTRAIAPHERVMVIARVSKYIVIAILQPSIVFHEKTVVFSFDHPEQYFPVLSSSFHEYWAWKYSSTMREGWINFAPSDCFENFPFPPCLREKAGTPGNSPSPEAATLESIGQRYYDHRQALMHDVHLGLTKTYNLFHDPDIIAGATDLSALEAQLRKSGATIPAAEAVARIQILRDLHVEMDTAALIAYGWTDIPLGHGFHEVDFLPENDRVRYTISPIARREVLTRLLELNHKYHGEEAESPAPARGRKKSKAPRDQLGLQY